tara:strand:+ start:554 stop:811 length:258 start_codon:yes stop_codon:yes gene_type:complete
MKKLPAKIKAARKKPGGSNVGKYTRVKASEKVGPKGGAPKGSFPINTMDRARAALRFADKAPNPQGIRNAVYKEYPSLKPKKKKT